jgi:hypothetical protein
MRMNQRGCLYYCAGDELNARCVQAAPAGRHRTRFISRAGLCMPMPACSGRLPCPQYACGAAPVLLCLHAAALEDGLVVCPGGCGDEHQLGSGIEAGQKLTTHLDGWKMGGRGAETRAEERGVRF